MESDNGKPSALTEKLERGRQHTLQLAKLVIDGYAKRLKHLSRGVPVPSCGGRITIPYDIGKLQSRFDGLLFPFAAYRRGNFI